MYVDRELCSGQKIRVYKNLPSYINVRPFGTYYDATANGGKRKTSESQLLRQSTANIIIQNVRNFYLQNDLSLTNLCSDLISCLLYFPHNLQRRCHRKYYKLIIINIMDGIYTQFPTRWIIISRNKTLQIWNLHFQHITYILPILSNKKLWYTVYCWRWIRQVRNRVWFYCVYSK